MYYVNLLIWSTLYYHNEFFLVKAYCCNFFCFVVFEIESCILEIPGTWHHIWSKSSFKFLWYWGLDPGLHITKSSTHHWTTSPGSLALHYLEHHPHRDGRCLCSLPTPHLGITSEWTGVYVSKRWILSNTGQGFDSVLKTMTHSIRFLFL